MAVQLGRRLVWLSIIVLLLLSALGGRLYTVEVARSKPYTLGTEAEVGARQTQTQWVSLGLGRGQILDRDGRPLADPQSFWGVAVFPSLMPFAPKDEQIQAEATALAVALGLPVDEVRTQLVKGGASWLSLAASGDPLALTPAQRTAVQELGLPGVVPWQRVQRYGDGALARQLVGYLNEHGAVQGLERAFDDELKGAAAPTLTAFHDGRGAPLGGEAVRVVVPTVGKPPYDVVTTIDRQIQQAVEQVLDAHDPKSGSAAVVMDPVTGEVLAMASRPQFRYGQDPVGGAATNRAVRDRPPGSVFKAITAAAALERKRVRPDDQFDCHKELDLTLSHQNAASQVKRMTFREAMAESCNSVFLEVGAGLGVDVMLDFAQRFGFGARTGALGLNRSWLEEAAGKLPDAKRDQSAVQMAFGQGTLRVTPLQLARAYSAIANDGILPPVKLVREVRSPAGEVIERPAAGPEQHVISPETAATLRDLLRGVTEPGGTGTGTAAWIPSVGAAGKTGTAEVDPNRPNDWDAWFAGYLPLRRPRYVVVVRVEDGGYGGTTAAPMFREIGQAILAIKGY